MKPTVRCLTICATYLQDMSNIFLAVKFLDEKGSGAKAVEVAEMRRSEFFEGVVRAAYARCGVGAGCVA